MLLILRKQVSVPSTIPSQGQMTVKEVELSFSGKNVTVVVILSGPDRRTSTPAVKESKQFKL